MDEFETILEKLNILGISMRKLIKEQKDLLLVQKEIAASQEDSKLMNQQIKQAQEELKLALLNLGGDIAPESQDAYLTKAQVMVELCIETRTFYRRRRKENWISKTSDGQLYYLRSSLMKDISV
jgi:hypothetical protein